MQSPGWSFVAMEYYALVLNRCFVISIERDVLRGVQCRGPTSAPGGSDSLTRFINHRLAVHGDLEDPSSYIDPRLQRGRRGFSIPLKSIESVQHERGKKWGMAHYPHDGRILLEADGRKREFIVLGRQSGSEISSRIRAAAGLARSLAALEAEG